MDDEEPEEELDEPGEPEEDDEVLELVDEDADAEELESERLSVR